MTINELAAQYLKSKAEMNEAKNTMEEAKRKLCAMLDETGGDEFKTDSYHVKRGQTSQMRFNSQAFRADFGDIYEGYKAPVTVNNFTVTAY